MLMEIPAITSFEQFEAESLPMIRPAFRSKFGAIPWDERHAPRKSKHEWLVKNVITRGEQAMLVGASQSGKSFLAIDLAMAVARGTPWFGNKTRQGLVVYQAGESAKGVRDKRIPAYEIQNGLAENHDLPFVLLTLPIDLFNSDDDCDALITECQHWAGVYPDFGLELLVIDTFSAATPGADENGSKDVSGIRRRCKKLELTLGCTVLLVHHKNAAGTKARGHTSMFADVESVLDVSMLVEGEHTKNPIPMKDANGRKKRIAVVAKLKDGEDGRRFPFVLPAVKLGVDEDGDDVTSCIVAPPDDGMLVHDDETKPAEAKKLSNRNYIYLMSVRAALDEHGISPPPGVRLPSTVTVVDKKHVSAEFEKRWFDEEADPDKRAAALRRARKDCGEALLARNLIGSHDPWLWLTGRGLSAARPRGSATEAEPPAVTQNDESVTDLGPGW